MSWRGPLGPDLEGKGTIMKSAKWDVTNQCNLRCKHCSVAEMYFRGSPAPQLPLARQLQVLDRLAEGGVTHLSLLGGEPLFMGDGLFTLLERAKELRIRVSIVTNGILLDGQAGRRLLDCDLAALVVSIESPVPDIHNRIRGPRTFERTLANVKEFLALRGPRLRPKLVVNTVLSRANIDTFVQMLPFCRDLGADEWSALTLNHIGAAADNLDGLAVSQEEHTAIALKMGQMLSAPGFELKQLELNFAIVCPLIREYLCKRYAVNLPMPQHCCTAGMSLVYVSPDGELFLCDRVANSGYVGAMLGTARLGGTSLLEHSFDEIWQSRQFTAMFDFIQREDTYAGFEPCNHCKYLLDRSCNPCPLQTLRGQAIRYEECLKAEAYLGDIRHRTEVPQTEWEQAHQFAPEPRREIQSEDLDSLRGACPIPVAGVRHTTLASGDTVLMHPTTLELLRLNLMGTAIWEMIADGSSLKEIIAKTMDLYQAAAQAVGSQPASESVGASLRGMVQSFVLSLRHHGMIVLGERSDSKDPARGAPSAPPPNEHLVMLGRT